MGHEPDRNRTRHEGSSASPPEGDLDSPCTEPVRDLGGARRKFPHVAFETCAGGGARIDLGIFRYADQSWPSDNTDAFDRLSIQEGFRTRMLRG